jgi:hypothetical protein
MGQLSDILKQNIVSGLLRRSVQQCSSWAERYRVMGKPIPGPWTFKYHPWTREMHDSLAYKNVGMKSAQAGYTEVCLNRTFFTIDVKRIDCLYVLPNKTPDASDFSSARFDAALELSPHLQSLFSDVRNVGHKRAGSTNLYVRGSRSRGGLKSIPTGFMVLDEFDEMDQEQVALALERMSGQFEKQVWEVSTPSIPNWGIHKEYLLTTQEHFFFKCPHCSRRTELTFPESFVCTAESLTDPKIHESYVRCKECHHAIDHDGKWSILQHGIWEPTFKTDPDVRGFHVNQLYSSTVKPVELARAWLKSQLDPAEEQEFFNSKLGMPHTVAGAQVTDENLNNCIRDYRQLETATLGKVYTMGVDVGSWLHVVIVEWQLPEQLCADINTHSVPRVVKITKLRNFEDLDKLMSDFQIRACVIDMFPERRKAKEFADRFYGFIKLCYYGRGVTTRGINTKTEGDELTVDHQVTVDRTSWLDLTLGRVIKGSVLLPKDLPEEYKENLKNQVRKPDKDANGNPIATYVSTGPDHYGHAQNYAEIALPLAAAQITNSNVSAFL